MDDQSPKPIRCKAAVCRAAGEPLTVEEIVVDPPKAYEIRIKIVCTSLCHSDITFWRGKAATAFPRILGHEAYGVVESLGEHVEGFAAGDTVVPTFLSQCDRCPGCASEHNNLCSTVPFVFGPGMRRDGTTRFHDSQGNPLHDLVAVSSFSEYTVVDVTQVIKIDPAVPPKLACLLSCGASTGDEPSRCSIEFTSTDRKGLTDTEIDAGVGAAWKVAKVEPGSSVVIFGLGSIGLAVAQGAKMCGASKIIGVDLNPDKEEVGKSFGVTHFVNPSQLGNSSVSEEIGKLTGGGADYGFECIGVSSVMTDAFTSTKPGKGKTIILGFEKNNEPISLPSLDLLSGKCVMGSYFGGMKPKTDVPILAQKCMNKELELEGLVTHEVGLQEINQAFNLLLQGKSLRCLIWMDE
nr:alcohol dehydrogenase-like 2 isoform X1 [Setaria viridis]